MKIAVIIDDANMAANVGGSVQRTVRTFDLPYQVTDYIEMNKGSYINFSFALVDEDHQPPVAP